MTVKVTWLGHACVLLDNDDTTILIDPWIENPKFPNDSFNPEKIDVILVTHGHNDHFGNVLKLAKQYKSTIPVIHEMSLFLMDKLGDFGGKIVGMNFGGTYEYNNIKITLVPSSHSSGFSDDEGVHYLGSPGGYVVSFPDGNSFYHCGDSGVTNEMEITKDLFGPKFGLLAIGGHYTMDPAGAAYAAKMLNLKVVLPIHWGTFVPPLNGTPEELKSKLTDSGIEVKSWKPGDTLEF
jgi:L-ascorbate metabolism protein UlaG (beta-lactamase superfamily)